MKRGYKIYLGIMSVLSMISIVFLSYSIWLYARATKLLGLDYTMSPDAVAIIGSADGPTSIFVAHKSIPMSVNPYVISVFILLLTIVSYIVIRRKCRSNKE